MQNIKHNNDQQCYRPYLFEGVLKVVRIGDEGKSRDYRTSSILGLTDLLQKEGKGLDSS